MNAPFPFGFEFATAFYLVLYVATLVVHVVFMNYVIAGTACMALSGFAARPAAESTGKATIASVLRDWMPFALSAAITAGVAPLLFIQILYKKAFYTANLLLFHRWMAILPVLIVGFYLLYALKARRVNAWPRWAAALLALGAFSCFAFTGYSWTENHLLSRQEAQWADFYVADGVFFRDPELLPRLCVWFLGAFPTMAVLVGWQLRHLAQRARRPVSDRAPRTLALLSAIILALSAAAGTWYYQTLDAAARAALTGVVAFPYLGIAIGGMILQAVAWLVQMGRPAFSGRCLTVASFGVLAAITGVTVARETLRLNDIGWEAYSPDHANAWQVGGLPVFLVFAVLNAGLIVLCLILVRRGLAQQPPKSSATAPHATNVSGE